MMKHAQYLFAGFGVIAVGVIVTAALATYAPEPGVPFVDLSERVKIAIGVTVGICALSVVAYRLGRSLLEGKDDPS